MTIVAWVDAVIACTLVEVVVLLVFHRRTGRGVAPSQFLLNVVAGLGLMLALRAGLAGAAAELVLAALAAAGLAHAADLWRRWKR